MGGAGGAEARLFAATAQGTENVLPSRVGAVPRCSEPQPSDQRLLRVRSIIIERVLCGRSRPRSAPNARVHAGGRVGCAHRAIHILLTQSIGVVAVSRALSRFSAGSRVWLQLANAVPVCQEGRVVVVWRLLVPAEYEDGGVDLRGQPRSVKCSRPGC